MMMRAQIFWPAVVFAAMMLLPQPAAACSCIAGGPPCEELWKAHVVFAGRVTAIEPHREDADHAGSRVVRLETIEVFRGTTGRFAEVVTGSGGGDCGYPFTIGERYLVYAYATKDGSRLATNICTRTRPIVNAHDDLEYARGVAKAPALGGTVRGAVRHEAGQSALPGVTVIVERDGVPHRAVSDAAGRFSVSGLPVGSYQVRVELPESQYASVWPQQVKIPDPRACAEVTVVVRSDGRVAGRVLDSSGRPVAALTVGLAPRESFERRMGGIDVVDARTDPEGRYIFSKVPPGRYVIGVNIRTGLDGRPILPRIFFSGASTVAEAATIDVGEGQHVEAGDVVLPPSLRIVAIAATVVTEEGRPASGASVYLHSDANRTAMLAAPAVADANGRVTIAAPEGFRYTLVAEYPRPLADKAWNVDRGETPVFAASPALPPLRIVVRPIPQ